MFENKGEVVGVSNPHPHCQIYATNFVFKTIENEAAISQRYWDEHRRTLMEEIIAREEADGRRILGRNDSAVAFIPYFARYAYETFVVPAPAAREPGRSVGRAEIARPGRGAPGGLDAVRQPLGDAVPVRDGLAPGADGRADATRASTSTSSSTRPCASRTC